MKKFHIQKTRFELVWTLRPKGKSLNGIADGDVINDIVMFAWS
jgi:hypothetical protein